MRRSTRLKLDKVGLASIALGCVLLVAFGLKAVVGDGSDGDPPSADGQAAFRPFGADSVLEDGEVTPQATQGGDPLAPGALGSALSAAGTFGELKDNNLHTVVLTATSDGGMYVGWRFRGGGKGVKVADRSTVVKKSVYGPLPVAQFGVQLFSSATYGTCTLSVDGVVVSTKTVRGEHNVVVCVG